MIKAAAIAISSAALISCVQPATDPTRGDLEGQRITHFRIVAHGFLSPGDKKRILAPLRSRKGARYSQDKLDKDIRDVYHTGLVEDLQFFVEPEIEGVRITAEITPTSVISTLRRR